MTVCQSCGKVFQPARPSYDQKFCSVECYNIVRHGRNMHTCIHCGKEFFDAKHPDRKFCSKDCLQQSRREIRICEGCGVEFSITQGQPNKYCSIQCAYKNRPNNQVRKQVEHICEWCGITFSRPQSRQGRFCSRQCAGEYGARQPKPSTRKPENFVTLQCEVCKQPYTVHKTQTEGRTSRYCSDKCKYEGQGKRKRGAGNHNYRGGKVAYRGRNWGSQSRKALKRDGYKCQICHKQLGKKKWDYGVHHIKAYREFNGDYETANQLSNLITLCRVCHGKVEMGKLPCPRPLL